MNRTLMGQVKIPPACSMAKSNITKALPARSDHARKLRPGDEHGVMQDDRSQREASGRRLQVWPAIYQAEAAAAGRRSAASGRRRTERRVRFLGSISM